MNRQQRRGAAARARHKLDTYGRQAIIAAEPDEDALAREYLFTASARLVGKAVVDAEATGKENYVVVVADPRDPIGAVFFKNTKADTSIPTGARPGSIAVLVTVARRDGFVELLRDVERRREAGDYSGGPSLPVTADGLASWSAPGSAPVCVLSAGGAAVFQVPLDPTEWVAEAEEMHREAEAAVT